MIEELIPSREELPHPKEGVPIDVGTEYLPLEHYKYRHWAKGGEVES